DRVAIAVDYAPDDGPILLSYFAPFELPAQQVVNLIVLGDNEQTARAAVETMDDSRSQLTCDVTERVEMELQARRQRAPVVRFAGMRDQSSRFVDDNQKIVFVHDFERNVLGKERLVGNLRQPDRQNVVDPQTPAGFDSQAVHQHALLLDRLLEEGP